MKLSVVIASAAGGEFLPRCLNSIKDQVNERDTEVIVVDRCGGETVTRIEREYPFVQLIQLKMNNHISIPAMRMLGAQKSRGDIVAILEEHKRATPFWIKTIKDNFKDGDTAIGGPILSDNYDRLTDWLVYFSEYSNYLPPWLDEHRYLLNCANIAYDRLKLLKYSELLERGYWEVILHPRLAEEGSFRSIANMGVFHTGPYNYLYYLGQRYYVSRSWGGSQRAKVNRTQRLIHLLTAPILPAFLVARMAQKVLKSGQFTLEFISTLPLQIPVLGAYALGEWIGYLAGYGNALEMIE